MSDYTTNLSLYNAKRNLLEILESRNFIVEDYKNTDINEIGIQNENKQLDMLLKDNKEKQIYVKFYINKTLKTQNIYDIIQDLFYLDEILSKKDDLMIVIKEEPNSTIRQILKDIWENEGIYISLISIKRLQFNILKHELVPKHTILSEKEAIMFKKQYNITDNDQLPDISYFSPVSIVIGLRPGNIVKIDRKSRTSIITNFYRICKIL
jgi:DNA-directed RNA polymerase subunit H (RpoH/RPB5)